MAKKAKVGIVVQSVNPTAELIERGERLVMLFFQRDREILLRKEKLLNRTLDIIERETQKQDNEKLAGVLQTMVSEFSKSLDKVIDLKKLQAMAPEMKQAAKGRAAGARSV